MNVNVFAGSVSPKKLEKLQAKLEKTKLTLESANQTEIAALTRDDILGDMFYAGGLGYYAQLRLAVGALIIMPKAVLAAGSAIASTLAILALTLVTILSMLSVMDSWQGKGNSVACFLSGVFDGISIGLGIAGSVTALTGKENAGAVVFDFVAGMALQIAGMTSLSNLPSLGKECGVFG